MTPPSSARTNPDNANFTWSALGKAVLGLLVAWAAYEFRQMREAIYDGGKKTVVLETKVDFIERDHENTKKRVSELESKLMEGNSK